MIKYNINKIIKKLVINLLVSHFCSSEVKTLFQNVTLLS